MICHEERRPILHSNPDHRKIFRDISLIGGSPNEWECYLLVPAPFAEMLTLENSHMSSITGSTASVAAQPHSALWKDKILPALLAGGLGCVLVFGTGFVEASAVHNAAHDGRHSAGIPCH